MKAKIIKADSNYKDKEFKVISINYEFVLLNVDNNREAFRKNEVEIIPETKYDDIFLDYEDILKIKLNKGMPIDFYPSFISFIEELIKTRLVSLDVLEDNYEFIKKGVWEKKLLVTINKERAFRISVIGTKYSKDFRFTIKEIKLTDFLDECIDEIVTIKEEITEKRISKERYEKSLEDLINNEIFRKKPILLKRQ